MIAPMPACMVSKKFLCSSGKNEVGNWKSRGGIKLTAATKRETKTSEAGEGEYICS